MCFLMYKSVIWCQYSSLSTILGGMERAGLLERSTRDENRRTVYVRLTDLGREQCRRLNAIFAAAEEEALRGFSPQEMQQVQTLLERIYRNLND